MAWEEGKYSEGFIFRIKCTWGKLSRRQNEWSKFMWEVELQVEEFLPLVKKKSTSEDINVYFLYI